MISVEFRGKHGSFCYQTLWSVGADLCAQEGSGIGWEQDKWVIEPGKLVKIPTGVFVKSFEKIIVMDAEGSSPSSRYLIPELHVRPRSGLTAKGIWCGFGSVDPDYPGDIGVTLINLTSESVVVNLGDRIAQLVGAYVGRIEGVPIRQVVREGGFGSTGIS